MTLYLCRLKGFLNIFNILLVDNETAISTRLSHFLRKNKHNVITAVSIAEARSKIKNVIFDMAIIERQLPDGDGLDILDFLNSNEGLHYTGVIITSSLDTKPDTIEGFKKGADDYLMKPVNNDELLCRISAILRRIKVQTEVKKNIPYQSAVNDMTLRHFHQFTLCLQTRFLKNKNSTDTLLTEGEFHMLSVLLNHQGAPVSRAKLLQVNSNRELTTDSRTIDVIIGRLRKKLGDLSSDPKLLVTVRGKGYMICH